MDAKISLIHLLQSRGSLFCFGAIVFCATVVALCGQNSAACFSVILTDGVVALGWVTSAILLGLTTLKWVEFDFNPCLRVAVSGGLGLGIFSLVGLGLGLAGWLSHWAAIAFPVISVIIFVADLLRRHSGRVQIERAEIYDWMARPAGPNWLWLVCVLALAVTCVSASLLPGILWKPLDPHPYDVTSYHLLVPREWYEGGRIVALDHNVFSYFPFNVEIQFLLLMHAMGGPWAGMYSCQFISVGYAGLMVLAVGGVGAEYERRTSNVQHLTSKSESFLVRHSTFSFSTPLAAALVSLVPWTVMLAGVAYVETALMLYTALAIGQALAAMRTPEQRVKLLVLSGIMAGLACGVKITAVPMLLVPMCVGLFVCLWFADKSERSWWRIGVSCSAFLLSGLVVLSPWLIRNFFWSGNPLFPIGMSVLGKGTFSSAQIVRFVTAHSPTVAQRSVLARASILWNDVLDYWQFGFVLLPAAIVAAALRWRDRQCWFIAICSVAVLFVWIGFTHLLPRFLVMLIPILGIAVAQLRWGHAWPVGAVLVFIGVGNLWRYVVPELCRHSNPVAENGQAQPAIFGIEDTSFMNSPELDNARTRHLQVGLVGDAQAFLYNIPMSHLHYRSVFDIGSGDAVDAWVGPQVKGDPNWLLVINPTEIDRLHRTYVDVPAMPPEWAARGPRTFFVRGSDLKR